MTPRDIQILRALPPHVWSTIVLILRQHHLHPPTNFARARTMVSQLHLYGLTMADIIHTLTLSAPTSVKATQALRTLYATLLPTLPTTLLTLLDPTLAQQISAVYPEFLPPDNPYPPHLYRVGATIADLHLILGIPLHHITSAIASGGLVLSPIPSDWQTPLPNDLANIPLSQPPAQEYAPTNTYKEDDLI